MRDIEEIRKDLKTMRSKDVDQGFFKGRKYESESEHPDSQTPARTPRERAQWLDAAEYSESEGGKAASRLVRDIGEMYDLLLELGGDML